MTVAHVGYLRQMAVAFAGQRYPTEVAIAHVTVVHVNDGSLHVRLFIFLSHCFYFAIEVPFEDCYS